MVLGFGTFCFDHSMKFAHVLAYQREVCFLKLTPTFVKYRFIFRGPEKVDAKLSTKKVEGPGSG